MATPREAPPLRLLGRCFTADPSRPWCDGVAISGGRIATLGASSTAGPARTIDLGAAVAIPGLIDAHLHLLMGGLGLGQLDLSEVRSREAFERAIAARAREMASAPREQWLEAWGWSAERWPGRADPDQSWLAAAGERPAIAWRMDRHACVVNAAAIEILAARFPGLPEPPGGRVLRDAAGAATGLLVETAAWRLAIPSIPPPDSAAKRRAVREAEAHLHRMGITSVGAMEYASELREAFLPDLDARTLRIHATLLDREWPLDRGLAATFPRHDRLRVIGFKAFADGTLGLRTARMLEPYDDRPGDRGLLVELALEGHLPAWAKLVHGAGLSPSIHAIGDEAMRLALDAYASLDADAGSPPPRIEHCQTVHRDDLPRCRGRMLSVQPLHRCDDALVIERALGAGRLDRFFPLRSLLDHGATLAFGSDWPVVPPDPIAGIRAAVTGADAAGRVFRPQESIGIEEALLASTAHAAACLGIERCGRLREGWHADLTILDRDPLTADWLSDPPRVVATIAAGRVVWDEGILR